MPLFVNDSGAWKEPVPFVNDNGTWKEPASIRVNDAGTWKEVYPTAPTGLLDGFESWPSGTGLDNLPEGWTVHKDRRGSQETAGYFQNSSDATQGLYALQGDLAVNGSYSLIKAFDLTDFDTLKVDVPVNISSEEFKKMRAILYCYWADPVTDYFDTQTGTLQLDISAVTGVKDVVIEISRFTGPANNFDASRSYSTIVFDNLRGE